MAEESTVAGILDDAAAMIFALLAAAVLHAKG